MVSKKFFILFSILSSLFGTKAWAYDIAVKNNDGVTIYYCYSDDGKDLYVTKGDVDYWGNVVIPNEVTFMNRTRNVTKILSDAFVNCVGLTSITIPNTITSIGERAFGGCNGLNKVIVNDIAAWCRTKFANFYANPLSYAGHLYSDENTEITNLVIPEGASSVESFSFAGCTGIISAIISPGVKELGNHVFYGCSALSLVTISDSVTNIGRSTFSGCSELSLVNMSNKVSSIEERVFEGCHKLTSFIIPNSVERIGSSSFKDCLALTSVVIPNNVKGIGDFAFMGCSELKAITIGKSVTYIGGSAFYDDDLTEVVSLIEEPFALEHNQRPEFTQNTYLNATLYVPKGTMEKYKATMGWKNFSFIEEGTGGGTSKPQKCEKPTISYSGGKLTFVSSTEGAACYSTIADTDISSYSSVSEGQTP